MTSCTLTDYLVRQYSTDVCILSNQHIHQHVFWQYGHEERVCYWDDRFA